MVRWGIIGLGRMANTFAEAINEVKNSRLIGVASKSNHKLKKFNKNFNIESENIVNNYTELIKSKNIDAIYISTLNNTHVNLIIDCAKNSKKILCEKPIGLSLEQANLAHKIINKNNTYFYEAIAYRSHIQTNNLLELIKSGEIGEIYKIEASFGFKVRKIKKDSRLFNKDLGGGAILDVGCYPISFFNLFCKKGEKLKFIKSNGTFSFTNVEDMSEAEILIGKNIQATCKVSFKENLDNSCKIHGTKGKINIPSPWLPSQKSYIEIINDNSYYKKFTKCEKSVYATQIEAIANLFTKKSLDDSNYVNINESIQIIKILDAWKKSLI